MKSSGAVVGERIREAATIIYVKHGEKFKPRFVQARIIAANTVLKPL